ASSREAAYMSAKPFRASPRIHPARCSAALRDDISRRLYSGGVRREQFLSISADDCQASREDDAEQCLVNIFLTEEGKALRQGISGISGTAGVADEFPSRARGLTVRSHYLGVLACVRKA